VSDRAAVPIRQRIRDCAMAMPHLSDEKVAEEVLGQTLKRDLLPLIIREVGDCRRQLVRSAEAATGPRPAPPGTSVEVVGQFEPDPERFRALLTQRIALGDGTFTTWGEASVEQLRTRIALIARQEAALGVTRRGLEEAVAALEQSGARCLNDLLGAR